MAALASSSARRLRALWIFLSHSTMSLSIISSSSLSKFSDPLAFTSS
jgi:hypothetical protein